MTHYEKWEKHNKRMNRRRAAIIWALCIAGSWGILYLVWKLFILLANALSHAS